jgi:cytochrome c-type biogenesis protein CcmH
MVKHFRKSALAPHSEQGKESLRAFSVTRRVLITVSVLTLVLAVVSGLLYAQNSDRAKKIGGGLMCMCNCNQILTQCNHVGCTMSAKMIKELDERVQGSGSDDLIVQSFVQEFGPKVLASPPTSGFNLVAWFIPGIAFGAGLALVIVVIRHWRKRMELTPAAAGGPAVSPEFMERARRQADRETED